MGNGSLEATLKGKVAKLDAAKHLLEVTKQKGFGGGEITRPHRMDTHIGCLKSCQMSCTVQTDFVARLQEYLDEEIALRERTVKLCMEEVRIARDMVEEELNE